jgi:hypothetical protein
VFLSEAGSGEWVFDFAFASGRRKRYRPSFRPPLVT